jgi:hypothetical protein
MGFHDVKHKPAELDDVLLDEEVDPLVKRARINIREAEEGSRKDWLDEYKECRAFVAGDQWPDADEEVLKKNQKPKITFNRSAPLIEVVVGTEVNQRRRMIFSPQDRFWKSSQATSDLATSAVDWALELAKAPHARSRIFRDALIGGLGWGYYYIDTVVDPNGRLAVKRVDPVEMVHDPNARDTNCRDMRWCARKRRWSREEIRDEFGIDVGKSGDSGDYLGSTVDVGDDEWSTSVVQHHPDPWRMGSQERKGARDSDEGSDSDRKKHVVVEYQSYELEKYVRVLSEDIPYEELGIERPEGAAPAPPPPMPMGMPPGGSASSPFPPDGMAPGGGSPPPGAEMAGPIPSGPAAPAPGGMPATQPAPQGPPAPAAGPPGMGPGGPAPGAPMPGGMPPEAMAAMGGMPPGGPPPGPPPVPSAAEMPDEDGHDHPEDEEHWVSYSLEDFEEIATAMADAGMEPPRSMKLKRRAYKQLFYCKNKVLRKQDMDVDEFTYRALTCKWDDENKVWYGLMRALMDPQRAANKWLSQGIAMFNSSAKGVLLIEENVVSNPRSLVSDWTRPNGIIQFKPDTLAQQRYQVVPPPPFAEAPAQIMQWSIGAMHDVTGISVDMQGNGQGDQSPTTMQKRQSQAMTVLATVFDALDEYREDEAWLALKMVKEYLTDGRYIRVSGTYPAQKKYIRLLKEEFANEYDLRLDDAPRDPNQRMAVFQMLQPMLSLWEREGGVPDPIKDFFPLPASTVADWKKWDADKKAAPPPPPPKDQDPEFIKAEIAYKNAQAALMNARAKAILQESTMGMLETAQDIDIEKKKLQLKAAEIQIQLQQLDLHASHKTRELDMKEDEGTLNALEANKRYESAGFPGE